MSVIGIDFGFQNCSIAVAQKGGVDVLMNEVSSRQTPCMVAFEEKQRAIGEPALTGYLRNIKNTITNIKNLLGCKFSQKEVQEEISRLQYKVIELPNNQIGIEVMYCQEKKIVTPTQIVGMILVKLKEIAERATQKPVADVVISVPDFWTEPQRQALLEAANIAGLHCLRLLNDTTASALQYGIYKTNLSETDPIRVMFIDMGASNTLVSIVEFIKGKLRVISKSWDRTLGGRDFDKVLVDHFIKEFQQKYKIDIRSNQRALIRLEVACEKLKKVLNINPEAPINIESIMNDVDAKGIMKKADFEKMCQPLLDRLINVVENALKESEEGIDKLFAIEITGAGTRLSCVQNRLQDFFKKDISKTLNFEESVVKGCALQCAILSPLFKVREFFITDINPYPIKISWNGEEKVESIEIFCRNNIIPCSKALTIYKDSEFDIISEYSQPDLLPPGTSIFLGKYHIPVPKKEESHKIRVKVKIDINNMFKLEDAQLIETIEEIEQNHTTTVSTPTSPSISSNEESNKMETEETSKQTEKENQTSQQKSQEPPQNNQQQSHEQTSSQNNSQQPQESLQKTQEQKQENEKKKKTKVKRIDLNITSHIPFALPIKQLNEMIEEEHKMIAADRLAIETVDRKNAVESYIYDMRGKINESLASFATDDEKIKFEKLLNETENWLYEEGENCTKSVYIQKLNELQALGNPIVKRKYEYENRYDALVSIRKIIDQYKTIASSEDPQYSHIEKEEKNKVIQECNNVEKFINEQMSKQDKLPKFVDPIILVETIQKKENRT